MNESGWFCFAAGECLDGFLAKEVCSLNFPNRLHMCKYHPQDIIDDMIRVLINRTQLLLVVKRS
jgi:hypothetical protein